MSSTPFGEHLKREREMRGVSLDEISAATRISTRFLEALENEQWDRLPGGAFNRGFIRSIARFLGIDEDALVAEYAFEHKDSEAARASAAHSEQIPRNWQPAAVAIVALALIVAAGFFAYRHFGAKIAARLHSRFAGVAADSHSSSASSSSTAGSASTSAKESAGASDTSLATPALELSVQASKPVDITVVADGKTVFTGSLQSNDIKQFEAHDAFEIDSAESSALTMNLNGRAIPLPATPGPPGKITLTRSDLQPAAEASH